MRLLFVAVVVVAAVVVAVVVAVGGRDSPSVCTQTPDQPPVAATILTIIMLIKEAP